MNKLLLAFTTSVLLIGANVNARPTFKEANDIIANAPSSIKSETDNALEYYEFTSRFDGKESASYPGQSFRHLLIGGLKGFMGSLKAGSYQGSNKNAEAAFNSYLKFNSLAKSRAKGAVNGNSRHSLAIYDVNKNRKNAKEGNVLNSVQSPGKNLSGKLAGNDNDLRHGTLLGWGPTLEGTDLLSVDADKKGDAFVEPEDLIQAIFSFVAKNAAKGNSFTVENGSIGAQRVDGAYVSKSGVDYNQIVHKFLQGAVVFSQAAGDYMSDDMGPGKGLRVDNVAPYKGNLNHTALEHHWDEGFGYFGAARDYLDYSDLQIAQKVSKDSNIDKEISIFSEVNLGGIAINAGRFDYTISAAGDNMLDLTGDAMNAFIKGRHLITQMPADYAKYVSAYATLAVDAMEKTVAATVMHYINSTINEMSQFGTVDYLFKDHAKFWSEAKGYALAFQFNPTSRVSTPNFKKLHELMGDAPVLMDSSAAKVSAYKASLLQARKILQEAFEFSDTNTQVL